MSNCFDSIDDIKNLYRINDLSIIEIEKRAQPPNFKEDEDEKNDIKKVSSQHGWLGVSESFLQCLENDWMMLEKLSDDFGISFSHLKIAHYLEQILSEAEEIRKKHSYGPNRKILIKHAVSPYSVQSIIVDHICYSGDQFCLFYSHHNPLPYLKSKEKKILKLPKLCCKWNDEYLLTNEQLGISVLIAGNKHNGIIPCIKYLGFYEGGFPENPYRVELPILLTLLTGKINEDFISAHEIKSKYFLKKLDDEIQDLASSLTSTNEDEKTWAKENIQILETKREKLYKETKKFNKN